MSLRSVEPTTTFTDIQVPPSDGGGEAALPPCAVSCYRRSSDLLRPGRRHSIEYCHPAPFFGCWHIHYTSRRSVSWRITHYAGQRQRSASGVNLCRSSKSNVPTVNQPDRSTNVIFRQIIVYDAKKRNFDFETIYCKIITIRSHNSSLPKSCRFATGLLTSNYKHCTSFNNTTDLTMVADPGKLVMIRKDIVLSCNLRCCFIFLRGRSRTYRVASLRGLYFVGILCFECRCRGFFRNWWPINTATNRQRLKYPVAYDCLARPL